MDINNQERETPLISVIMPVYNLDTYLPGAVDSVLAQTYPCWELILVDDGSQDSSGRICDAYAEREERVRVIHQKNSGSALARGAGVAAARGEYVTFVDADDWVDRDFLAYLWQILNENQASMSVCVCQKVYEGQKVTEGRNEGKVRLYTPQEALASMLYRKELKNNACGKLLKKTTMEQYPFPDYRYYEDLAVVYRWYAEGTVAYGERALYFYRQRRGSKMHSEFREERLCLLQISQDIEIFIEKHYPGVKAAADSRRFVSCLQLLRLLPSEKKFDDVQHSLKQQIVGLRGKIFRDRQNSREIRIMALVSYLGMPFLKVLGKGYDWAQVVFRRK